LGSPGTVFAATFGATDPAGEMDARREDGVCETANPPPSMCKKEVRLLGSMLAVRSWAFMGMA
jgi:hypothetical protein